MTKAYFRPEQLKRINDDPALVSLLYDLDLLPEQVIAGIRHAHEEERERCAKVAENMRLVGGFLAGETPGPLFDAGWNGCAAESAKMIRESSDSSKGNS